MNIQEVKPCPFCGCKTVQVVDGSTFRWAKAECDNCGASCGEVRVNTTQARNETEIRAAVVEEWNKRIADPLQTRIDELPWIEQFKEYLFGLRKASYEFGVLNHSDDHEKMLECQRAIFAMVDELMLEYCPDEMTAEQKARWAECQKVGNDGN